jgi:hypothetical protein
MRAAKASGKGYEISMITIRKGLLGKAAALPSVTAATALLGTALPATALPGAALPGTALLAAATTQAASGAARTLNLSRLQLSRRQQQGLQRSIPARADQPRGPARLLRQPARGQ